MRLYHFHHCVLNTGSQFFSRITAFIVKYLTTFYSGIAKTVLMNADHNPRVRLLHYSNPTVQILHLVIGGFLIIKAIVGCSCHYHRKSQHFQFCLQIIGNNKINLLFQSPIAANFSTVCAAVARINYNAVVSTLCRYILSYGTAFIHFCILAAPSNQCAILQIIPG